MTLNYSFIHKLPGTTLSKIHQRIGFKAEDDACLTLDELDRLIHIWISNKYHVRPHIGLKRRCPIEVWKESALLHPPQLKANAKDVEIQFCEVTTSSLQHYGIDLNKQKYASVELTNLRRMLPAKQNRVDVKWPRTDMGHIYVWDPFENSYFEVPNIDESYRGLTLDQANAVNKAEKANPEMQRVRGKADVTIGVIVEDARKDKHLKGRKKAERLNNSSAKKNHIPVTNTETDQEVYLPAGRSSEIESTEYEIESMAFAEGTLS